MADQGRGPEAKLKPEGPKKNFWETEPPLDDPPSLSQGLDPALRKLKPRGGAL